MTTGHEPFDQQIHDAFDQVELSEDAQDRILARLMAAQASKAEERAEEEAHEAEVIVVPPRRIPWGRWVSLAAVLVAALVVVRITVLAPNASPHTVSVASQDVAEKSGAVESAEATTAPEMAPEAAENAPAFELDAPLSDEDVSGEAAEQPVSLTVPRVSIKLDNGMWFTTEGIDPLTSEVGLERVGELMGAGVAYDTDAIEGDPGVACEVFSLLDEPDAYAVRLDDEQVCWRCVPA